MTRGDTRAYIDTLLQLIGSGGFSGITVPTNSFVSAISYINAQQGWQSPRENTQIATELRRQSLVTAQKNPDSIQLQLTVKGIHRVQRSRLESLVVPIPEKWDKKWRMVVFDIPARKAESRYILTSQLRRLGFVMIQRSVWFHPYPCFDQISELLVYANLQPFVTLAEVSQIDRTSQLKLLRHYPELRR